MSRKILLADGRNLLEKAYYGSPDQCNLQGAHVGAIYGFWNLLLKVLKDEKIQQVTVVMENTWCSDDALPYALREQLEKIPALLTAMGTQVVFYEKEEEISFWKNLIETSAEPSDTAVILSGRETLTQLLSSQTEILLLKTQKGQRLLEKIVCDEENNTASDSLELPVFDPYTKEAYELCKTWELTGLLPGFILVQEEELRLEQNFFTCANLSGCEALFEKAAGHAVVGVSFLCDKERGYGIGLALAEDEIYYIPAEGMITVPYIGGKLEQLSKTVQLASMDIKGMLKFIPLSDEAMVFDCGVAAYLLNPLKGTYPYEEVAREYLENVKLPGRDELLPKIPFEKAWAEELPELELVACYMAYAAFSLKPVLEEALKAAEMWTVYEEIELTLMFTLDSMEKYGIAVKGEELKLYGDQLNVRIQELEQEIWNEAGEEFNINSPKQLGIILFEKMEIPGGRKTKTGYSTSADVLEKLAPEYPFVSRILEYRQLAKLKSTYADGLGAVIETDGRIHSTFNQTITATGRISSTEPNLQNIPVRMELGRLIRKVFVPEEGFVFLDADYSQIELRVLAHMSGDEKLIQAYKEAEDIHRLTASQVFHIPLEEVTPLQRRNAKAVNFGIVYGISSFGLSQDLSITMKEAAEYIEKYFETYPKIKVFLDKLVEQGKENGYVSTMFGRRRPVPELGSSKFMQRSFGERAAMNAPIQGTAADIIKIAMNRVYRRLQKEGLKSRLVLQVHDELLIETWKPETEQVAKILEEEMKGAAELAVELEVDMHQGENWYEAK